MFSVRSKYARAGTIEVCLPVNRQQECEFRYAALLLREERGGGLLKLDCHQGAIVIKPLVVSNEFAFNLIIQILVAFLLPNWIDSETRNVAFN